MPEAFRRLQDHMLRKEGGDREMVDSVTIGDEGSTRGYLESGRLVCPWAVRIPSHHAN